MKDYILQYPVEPQMSVAVRVTAKRVIPLGLKTPELNKDQAGRGGERETGSQLNLMWIHQMEK